MYQAPEIWHLENAVKAIKRNLLPQKEREPTPENDESPEEQEPNEEPNDK